LHSSRFIVGFNNAILSDVGDVPVNSKAMCSGFVNLEMCQLTKSFEGAHKDKGKHAWMYVSI
jgi:hypothetical protein